MLIAILSRNRGLHSIRRFLREGKRMGMDCQVINPLDCQLYVDGRSSSLRVAGVELPRYAAVLPRIGASITDYGLAVVKQFETLGIPTVNSSRAIAESRDKLRCLQLLAEAGLRSPATVLSRNFRNLRAAVESVRGLPVVLKTLQGTQGVGVMLVHTPISLETVLETMRGLGQDVIIQQFIAEGAGRDYRALVVGDRVVAAMVRTAPPGEFRANIHRGGVGKLVKLPADFQRAAVKAAKVLGLEVAGVDLMESRQGPMIIEVNSSPGFEGIERATGLNIAAMILKRVKEMGRVSGRKRRSR